MELLLETPDGARTSDLERLRRGPTRVSGRAMAAALDRVSELTAIGVSQVEIGAVPRRRVIELARYGKAGKAPALRRHPLRPPAGDPVRHGRGAAGNTRLQTGPMSDKESPAICSAKGCHAAATWAVVWNNPRLHTPAREKVWVACGEHKQSLADYLTVRSFLKRVEPLEAV